MIANSLGSVFTSAVAPPLAIAALGYLLGRWKDIDIEPLSTVTIYLLLPALIFHSLATIPLSGVTALGLVVVMCGFTAIMALTTAIVGSLFKESGTILSGAMLAAAFPNVGNFGIPVATFAFGDIGRTTAVVFSIVQNVLMYTLGVYVLSRNGDGNRARVAAVKRVFALPMTYAVIAAGGALAFDLVPPPDGPTMQAVEMMGNASIPLFLIILGLQIADMAPKSTVRRVLPTVTLKLLIAPVVAVSVGLATGLVDTTAGQAFIVLAAGPAAVTPLVLTIEFTDSTGDGLSPVDYVGTVILLTIAGCLPIVTSLILLFASFP